MVGAVNVGMDIGGTKTHVLARRGAEIVVDDVVASENWRTWNLEHDAPALAELVLRLCGGAPPAALAIGAHGCDSDRECDELQQAMQRQLPSMVRVVNDAELMVPAAGYVNGIGVVAGTGSIAVARDREGRMLAAGGWGWILGDEGSAAALVREAARAVRGAIDRDDRSDALVQNMLREYGVSDFTKLGRALNEVRGAAAWGQHADVVFAAADAGSPLARQVIEAGGRALADLVGVLIGRGADAGVIVAGGGVIAEQQRLFDSFKARVSEIAPMSEVVLLRAAPVLGALALAERLSFAAASADIASAVRSA